MNHLFSFSALLAAMIVLSVLSACSNEQDESLQKVKNSGQFRVALSGDYPPFSFYNSEGRLAGFDVDVAREIAKRLGVTFKPIITAWTDKISGLSSGKFDAILGCVAVGRDGLKALQFTAPYYFSTSQVLVKKGQGYKTVQDLVGKRVGAVIGTTFTLDVHKLEGVSDRFFKTHTEAFAQLQNGTLDALVTDRVVGENAIKTGRFTVTFLDTILDRRQVAIGLRKTDQSLFSEIESILGEMRKDGSLQTFIRKVARCEYDCMVAFQSTS